MIHNNPLAVTRGWLSKDNTDGTCVLCDDLYRTPIFLRTLVDVLGLPIGTIFRWYHYHDHKFWNIPSSGEEVDAAHSGGGLSGLGVHPKPRR
jgi:hypothetical protein